MRKHIITTCNEKTARQMAGSIGMLIGIFLACTILAYAAVQLFGSKKVSIKNTKGHTFEMDLTGVGEGTEVVPGDSQSLNSIAVQNKSSTDSIYAFIQFDYNPAVYKIVTDVTGWEVVQINPDSVVYSYSSGGTMTEVGIGDKAQFTGTLTCIADSATFQVLEDEDMTVTVTGYAISTGISRSGNADAWEDYQNGGK